MKTESGLYEVLEEILKKSKNPMTCVEMFNLPVVKEHANSANRVSDYLGGLWRKGLVTRLPAPKDSGTASRWMYEWKPKAPRPTSELKAVEYSKLKKGSILSRPSLEISEDGKNIIIDLPSLRITIQTKD